MNFFLSKGKLFRVEGNPSKLCAVIAKNVERSEIIKITTEKS